MANPMAKKPIKKPSGAKSPIGKKTFGGKSPVKSFGGDKKPFHSDKKSLGKPVGKSFGRNSSSFGDKKSFDKKPFGDRKTFDKKPSFEKKSFGDKKSYGEKKAFGDRKPYGDTKPYGDKKPYGDTKSFEKKSFEKKPFEKKSYGGKPSFGRDKSFGEKKVHGPRRYGTSPEKIPQVEPNMEEEEFEEVEEESEIEIVPMESDEDEPTPKVYYAEDSNVDAETARIKKAMSAANRKGKKSGGFQSMGLSYPVFKAIGHQGYKIPTPIQRKTIPIIMQGRDMVAMARTGSGKTAAFLIPMIEKLKAHSAKVGARALVLSPSRELASQTSKFCKDIGKYTDLRNVVLVGGDQMDDQFASLAGNPDIIIATPGRLMHLILEMNLELGAIEYVVFDEADRLFEMGFAEQLHEILTKLPRQRQTVLFSATLPKLLVDFAKAGLENPALVRLDVDTKISTDLQMYFLAVKQEEKEAALLYLLSSKIPKDEQTVLFVATKHHVEYVNALLKDQGYECTYIYGALDQMARKHHLSLFKNGKVKILIVTDVAARGIDIPMLDHVINYDFPGSSKVFVHRVGRTARAGRAGCAWSLLAQDELPFMLDLQLFTGRPLVFASTFEGKDPDYTKELVYGQLPPAELAIESETVDQSIHGNMALEGLKTTSSNAYKMFAKSRPSAAKTSHVRAKEIAGQHIGIHPLFWSSVDACEMERVAMVQSLTCFRPTETIFEVGRKGLKTPEGLLMLKRRTQLSASIAKARESKQERIDTEVAQQQKVLGMKRELDEADDDEIFGMVGKRQRKRLESQSRKDSDYYLNYRPVDADTERGYAVNEDTSFALSANRAAMDVMMDDKEGFQQQRAALQWDAKKHKMVRETVGADNKKMIRTDSGKLVPATWKTDRFYDWQKKTKLAMPRMGDQELNNSKSFLQNAFQKTYRYNTTTAPNPTSKNAMRKQAQTEGMLRKKGYRGEDLKKMTKDMLHVTPSEPKQTTKSELKSAIQISKERKVKDQKRAKTGRHSTSKHQKGRK